MLNYLQWRNQNGYVRQIILGMQLRYNIKCNQKDYKVIISPYQPCQFNMGEISAISSIYDKKDSGWENINPRRYFLSRDAREDNANQPVMTSSHQFEENIIVLETMANIKKNRHRKESTQISYTMFLQKL